MRRFALCALCLCPLFAGVTVAVARAADVAPARAAATHDDSQAHGFDFLMGTWSVRNTFLAKRMQHSHEWLRFQATDIESFLRTGTGNLEYYLTDRWPDFVGMGLRLYDSQAHAWTIYWSDNRFSRGVLQPPVRGAFKGRIGVFEGADHLGSLPITVRYTWRNVDHDHARWSQAFSRDHGRTWETNWTMDFTRISENANASILPRALHAARR